MGALVTTTSLTISKGVMGALVTRMSLAQCKEVMAGDLVLNHYISYAMLRNDVMAVHTQSLQVQGRV